MFQELNKRRAIHSCRRKLGPYLAKHYGKSENYTPAQVETGAQKLGLGSIALRYGMAMYIARGDYNNYYDSPTQDSNYDNMRSEIADSGSDWFGGLFDAGGYDSCHHSGHDFGSHDGGFDGGGHASD